MPHYWSGLADVPYFAGYGMSRQVVDQPLFVVKSVFFCFFVKKNLTVNLADFPARSSPACCPLKNSVGCRAPQSAEEQYVVVCSADRLRNEFPPSPLPPPLGQPRASDGDGRKLIIGAAAPSQGRARAEPGPSRTELTAETFRERTAIYEPAGKKSDNTDQLDGRE